MLPKPMAWPQLPAGSPTTVSRNGRNCHSLGPSDGRCRGTSVLGTICLVSEMPSAIIQRWQKVLFFEASIERGELNPMNSLRNHLQKAQDTGKAIGHFNVADLVLLKAVFNAARELDVPVLVGLSEGEREFVGTRQIAALVRSLREEFDAPIFLNADHTHSLSKAVEATKAGFDSVVFDLSALPFEENIRQTREAVEALKSINPEVLVEGEIGDIGTGSEIHDTSPDLTKGLSRPEEASQFVQRTRVDVLAPAVGNMHGMLKSMVEGTTKKHLDIPRIKEIKRAAGTFLTLHGGSGTNDEDFRKAIAAGINVVHINTELRVAWRRGLERGLEEHKTEVVPYKILPLAVESVKEVVKSRLALFNGRAEIAQGA
jgi:fructose-bisphosphate aldolase, class II